MTGKLSAITLTTNNFVTEENELIRNGIDQETANEIYRNGGFIIISNLPKGVEVGIDYRTFIATQKFLGFKMIPPGLHFFTIKYKTAPNISFFLWFKFGTVYDLRWNQQSEDIEDKFALQNSSDESVRKMLMTYDDCLAVYPYTQFQTWQQLKSHISYDLFKRLKPTNSLGKYNEEIEFINNEEALKSNEEFRDKALIQTSDTGRVKITDAAGIPLVKEKVGFTIFFTKIPDNNDSSSDRTQLQVLLDRMHYKELLGELQYSFVVFLVGQSYVGLQQWKAFLFLLSDCIRRDVNRFADLFNEFIVILYSQLKLFEDGQIEEIFFGDKFLQTVLTLLFNNVEDAKDASPTLRRRVTKLKAFSTKKFEQSW